MQRHYRATVLISAMAVASAYPAMSRAQDSQTNVTGFYQGKTVEIIVPTDVGDTYDTLSRLVGRHISGHLPGRPTIVVRNLVGAGGIVAANYLYNRAPKDGTTFAMMEQSIYETQLFQISGLMADVTKLNWIGRILSNNAVLFAWNTAKVKKIDDAFDNELIVSASGRSSLIRWTVLKRVTGLKFNLITGHKGSSEGVLAMQRGEVDGLSLPWSIFRVTQADWIRSGQVNLLLQSGLDKATDLPNVPRLVDLAKTAEQKQLLELFSQSEKVGRSLAAPPDLPKDRVADLRKAFNATLKDPDFVAETKKMNLVLDSLPGEELQAIVAAAFQYQPEIVEKAKALTIVEKN